MNKILLVARREFLTRVQKKTFLLTTILLPLIIFGFYAMMIYFSVNAGEDIKIAVADEAGYFNGKIENQDEIKFSFLKNETPYSLKTKLESGQYDGYVYVPASAKDNGDTIQLVSAKSITIITRGQIEGILNKSLEEKRLLSLNIRPSQLDSIQHSKVVNYHGRSGRFRSKSRRELWRGLYLRFSHLYYFVHLRHHGYAWGNGRKS